jgi:hypothetical protein
MYNAVETKKDGKVLSLRKKPLKRAFFIQNFPTKKYVDHLVNMPLPKSQFIRTVQI